MGGWQNLFGVNQERTELEFFHLTSEPALEPLNLQTERQMLKATTSSLDTYHGCRTRCWHPTTHSPVEHIRGHEKTLDGTVHEGG
jgi:hypothetical protein